MTLTTEYIRHKKSEKELCNMVRKLTQFIEDIIVELTHNEPIKRQEMFERFVKYMSKPTNDINEECE